MIRWCASEPINLKARNRTSVFASLGTQNEHSDMHLTHLSYTYHNKCHAPLDDSPGTGPPPGKSHAAATDIGTTPQFTPVLCMGRGGEWWAAPQQSPTVPRTGVTAIR